VSSPPDYVAPHGLLAGKAVLITAAAGTGIGFATAKRCVEEGARVAISDAHERRIGEARDRLAEIGGDSPIVAVAGDVTVEDDVRSMVGSAVDAFGRLDVLVNNAGLGLQAPLLAMTDEQWSKVLDVTITGTMRMTRAALRVMEAQGSGVIVNNASVLGWRAQGGQSAYAAAKAGVMAFTRSIAIEAAPLGVRVNAVSPSLAMHENLSKVMDPDDLAALVSREAFGRAAEPWEVANVIVFLASEYSGYLTGEVISVSSQHP
jgi:3-oxoacyl-[acyl-carrier protein] reductase